MAAELRSTDQAVIWARGDGMGCWAIRRWDDRWNE